MDLFGALRCLAFQRGHCAIFGSGPLVVRGIIDATNDLDVITRGPAWERAGVVGEIEFVKEYGLDIVHCFDQAITIGRSWGYGEFDIDHLIDTAEMIDGLPFVQVELVIGYEEIAGRPKDLKHLRELEEFQADHI